MKANVPLYYKGPDSFGKTPQHKYPPRFSPTIKRVYEASENRTFFGLPAKCEGPGPAEHHN